MTNIIKDFKQTVTSYNLILENSETHEILEKVYDFNDDDFGGVSTGAGLKMLDDILNGEYLITFDNLESNKQTATLLYNLIEYRKDKNNYPDFDKFKNLSESIFTRKYYGLYLKANNGSYQIAYIADYNAKNNKLTEYVETTNIKSEDYGALIERHKALIEKTGELEGLKFRKFSFTQFLNLVFLADLDDYVYDFKEINDI